LPFAIKKVYNSNSRKDWVIPITYPTNYSKLKEDYIQEKKLPFFCICPKCQINNCLVFSKKTFNRSIIDYNKDNNLEHSIILLPFAYCSKTKSHFRILPINIAPYGKVSLNVKEKNIKTYITTNLSLEKVVSTNHNIKINRSSLYLWTKCLGSQGLALNENKNNTLKITMGAIIEESAKHLNYNITNIWKQSYNIDPIKYKSEKRKEELEYNMKILKIAQYVFSKEKYPLEKWNEFLLKKFYVIAFPISSKSKRTGKQQAFFQKYDINEIIIKSKKKSSKKGEKNGNKSPPSGNI